MCVGYSSESNKGREVKGLLDDIISKDRYAFK